MIALLRRTTCAALALLMVVPGVGWTQDDDAALRAFVSAKNLGKLALSEVSVPEPQRLSEFVVNRAAAIALGKSLFWDMQVGGDGVTACASCHYHAGADNRTKNQLFPAKDGAFGQTPSGGGGPNYTLGPADFPFPKSLDDVVSSQGVFLRSYDGAAFDPADACTSVTDATFHVGGINVRRVEPRNTPTTINAVFNHRNFWDGRANNTFNGVNPAGIRDQDAKVAVWTQATNSVSMQRLVDANGLPLLDGASLASQAVGPPLSILEMSCGASPARTFPDLGRKLLRLRPLAQQSVAADDSVLKPFRYVTGQGLNATYAKLISAAFNRKYWGYAGQVPGTSYTQMELNFSLFFGLAIQLYESTLVSGQTPYDRWAAGDNSALTPVQKLGLKVFYGFGVNATPRITDGLCAACHIGPEFTGASSRLRACPPAGLGESIERMAMGAGVPAIYDAGFYNIGVRATNEDLGVGAVGATGKPLSFSRQITTFDVVDSFCFVPALFEVGPGLPPRPGERVAVDGAFKTPTLRNVALTAPYFHNGGRKSLEEVVDFYDAGGRGDLGFALENIDNLDFAIIPRGFSAEEEAALIDFLRNALVDDRVRHERAPFDHPQLFIPNGHPNDEHVVIPSASRPLEAMDAFVEIPAVGAGGRTPPPNFLDLPQSF